MRINEILNEKRNQHGCKKLEDIIKAPTFFQLKEVDDYKIGFDPKIYEDLVDKSQVKEFEIIDKLSISIIAGSFDKIDKTIESIYEIADEIIICANGGHDEIEKLSESEFDHESKIIVYETKWESDFGKARQECLEKCENDWVLWMDTDDVVEEKFIERIKSIINGKTKIPVGTGTIEIKIRDTSGITFNQKRFFNKNKCRWEGKVHEQLISTHNNILIPNIEILHTGYDSKEKIIEKAKRNILIQEESLKTHMNAYDLIQTGRSFLTLGMTDKAKIYFTSSLLFSMDDDTKKYVNYMIARIIYEEEPIVEIQNLIQDNDLPDVDILAMQILKAQGNDLQAFERAVKYLLRTDKKKSAWGTNVEENVNIIKNTLYL